MPSSILFPILVKFLRQLSNLPAQPSYDTAGDLIAYFHVLFSDITFQEAGKRLVYKNTLDVVLSSEIISAGWDSTALPRVLCDTNVDWSVLSSLKNGLLAHFWPLV